MTVEQTSPEVIRRIIEAGMCPFCDRGPFALVGSHVSKVHGVDKIELRDLAGMTMEDKLCLPETSAKFSASFDPEQHLHHLLPFSGGKPGKPRYTKVGRARKVESARSLVEWRADNPEAAHDAQTRSHANLTPEGRARWQAGAQRVREANLRGHGTTACYKRGCRCDECRAANIECCCARRRSKAEAKAAKVSLTKGAS